MGALLGAQATDGLDAGKLGLTWRQIPAGTYAIGAEDIKDNPPENVSLDAFELADVPTTNAQFAAGIQQLGARTCVLMVEGPDHHWRILARGTAEELKGQGLADLFSRITMGDLFTESGLRTFDLRRSATIGPIVSVSLAARTVSGFDRPNQPALIAPIEASAFAAVFGLRLPTGVEWEAAAGDLSEAKYLDEKYLRNVAHFRPADATADVRSKQPNKFGLYDVLGEVWQAMANPYRINDERYRELRGGAWNFDASFARPARRASNSKPLFWKNNFGFRLAR